MMEEKWVIVDKLLSEIKIMSNPNNKPKRMFVTIDTTAIRLASFKDPAPRFCATSTLVPVATNPNITTMTDRIWFDIPTAATASSEY